MVMAFTYIASFSSKTFILIYPMQLSTIRIYLNNCLWYTNLVTGKTDSVTGGGDIVCYFVKSVLKAILVNIIGYYIRKWIKLLFHL